MTREQGYYQDNAQMVLQRTMAPSPRAQAHGLAGPDPPVSAVPPEEGPANAWEEEWKVMTSPELTRMFDMFAKMAGLGGFKHLLAQHLVTQTTQISLTSATHPAVPVSFDASLPHGVQPLRFYFEDYAFVRKLSAVVTGLRILGHAQPQPGFFEINELDYLYGNLRREGSGDLLMTQFLPLSHFSGVGDNKYFFHLIPVVRRSESFILELSIVPPRTPDNTVLLVDKIVEASFCFHTDRFAPFGI